MKSILFSRRYAASILQQELLYCMQYAWVDHFNQGDYHGTWDCISLRSAGGDPENIFGLAGADTYQDTALLAHVPYIQQLIQEIPGAKESIRLMALHPGSEIKPHRDRGCAYQEGYYRIHVPIVTHPAVEFYLEGERIHMQEGECWYLDFSKTHQVINLSDSVRVHLVIDGIRDTVTDVWFAEHGYIDPPAPTYDEATKRAMIAQLERMEDEGAKLLLLKLKEELQDA